MASFPALDLQWRSGPGSPELAELLHAALDEFEPQAIHDHETADGWRVFFRTPRQRDAAADTLRAGLGDRLLLVDRVDVADEEWARRSQANLTAIRVGRIVVAPPWDNAAVSIGASDDIVIVIDPSTGFGTGHHETTRLCLALMQGVEVTGHRVVDVGTGSGVLAIAAAKIGASAVVAFDEDPEALRNTRENVARNGVGELVAVEEADLGSFTGAPADLVLANLTSAVLVKHAGRLTQLVSRGGALIVSGFNTGETADISRALGAVVRELTEGDWAAALLTMQASVER